VAYKLKTLKKKEETKKNYATKNLRRGDGGRGRGRK